MNRDSQQSLNEIPFQPPSNRSSNFRFQENVHDNAQDVPSFNSLRSITKQSRNRLSQDSTKPPVCVRLSYSKRCYNNFKNLQKIVYTILEDPTSFIVARIFFYIIIIAIVFSTIDSIVWTTLSAPPPSELVTIENAISGLFLFEYTCRLFSATAFNQNFFLVMASPFNLIDLAVLIPFFIELGLESDSQTQIMLKTLRVARLLKMFRFAKIGRHMRGVEVFFQGVKSSVHSFGFLLLLLIVGDLVFATTFFYAENANLSQEQLDSPTRVSSLLSSMWWAIATITTVGYGDYAPNTWLGKVIGSLIGVSGMLMLALPVAILGVNFQHTFAQHLEKENIEKYKEATFKEHEKMDDSQKEIHFMNERINLIESKNKRIISLLTNSESLYKSVARDLRHMYKSIYADEKKGEKITKVEGTLQETKVSPMLGTKLEMRIKLYEKLNRVKKKISAANVFQKVARTRGLMSRTELGTTTENDRQVTERDRQGTERDRQGSEQSLLLVTSPRKDTVEEVNENPGDLKLIRATMKGSPIKIPYLSTNISKTVNGQEECDLETSSAEISIDIPVLETEVNISHANTYKHMFDNYRERMRVQIDSPRESEEHYHRFGIKCHTERGENDFLRYCLENLQFISQTLLDDLLSAPTEGIKDSSDDEKDSEESKEERSDKDAPDALPQDKPVTYNRQSRVWRQKRKRRRSWSNKASYNQFGIGNIHHPVNSKFENWRASNNFDPITWQLTEKIVTFIEKKKNPADVQRIENDLIQGNNNPMNIIKKAYTQPKSDSQKMKEYLRAERQSKFEEWVKEYKQNQGRITAKDLQPPSILKPKKKPQNLPPLFSKEGKKAFEEKELPPIQEDEADELTTPFSDHKTGSFRSRFLYSSTIVPE